MTRLLVFVLALFCPLQSTRASVKGPPEVSLGYLERYMVLEGDTVKLSCPITGSPRPLIEWYQDDHLIGPSWSRYRATRKYLKIKDVLVSDSGVYVCKGINGFGSQTVALNLVVQVDAASPYEAPVIVHRSRVPAGGHLLKLIGDTLRLECFVEGNPPPTIVWYKEKDEGLYRCKARNMWGEANAEFPVKVLESATLPEILGPVRRNLTLSSLSLALSCQVLSIGPTQVQWLRQVPKDEEPTDRNRSIVVFDFTFEILSSSTVELTRGPDNFYNATVHLRPALPGRYVCLANNPVGHAHKEVIIVRQEEDNKKPYYAKERTPDAPFSADSISSHIPLALVISVPLTSLVLLTLLLVFALCLRRTPSHFQKPPRAAEPPPSAQRQQHHHHQQQPSVAFGSGRASSGLHVNPLCPSAPATSAGGPSPYATSLITTAESAKKSGPEDAPASASGENGPDDLDWVEVTNKANQTPSHWVYSDMLSAATSGSDLVYPSLCSSANGAAAAVSTFHTYVAADSALSSACASMSNSPLMAKRKQLKASSLLLQRAASQQLSHSQHHHQQPPPPPPPPPYSTHVYANHAHAMLHLATPTRAVPKKPTAAAAANRDAGPEFFAVLKPQQQQQQQQHSLKAAASVDSGRDSAPASASASATALDHLYARPPSDHIYFKICEGRADFI